MIFQKELLFFFFLFLQAIVCIMPRSRNVILLRNFPPPLFQVYQFLKKGIFGLFKS